MSTITRTTNTKHVEDVADQVHVQPSPATTLFRYQIMIFFLTWLAYACANLIRKPVSVAKGAIAQEMSLNITQLGWLDTASLLPYAVFQLYAGSFGDRFGARAVLAGGLALAAFATLLASHSTQFGPMLAALALCGVGQSFVWPACSKALSLWFPESQRAIIFGLWGTCQAVGGFVGTLLASWLTERVGWRESFVIPVIVTLTVAIANYLTLTTPKEVGIEVPKVSVQVSSDDIEMSDLKSGHQLATASGGITSIALPDKTDKESVRLICKSALNVTENTFYPSSPEEPSPNEPSPTGERIRQRTSSRSRSRSRSRSGSRSASQSRPRSGSSLRTPVMTAAATLPNPAVSSQALDFNLGPADPTSPTHSNASRIISIETDIETDSESSMRVAVPLLSGGQAKSGHMDSVTPAQIQCQAEHLTLLEAFEIPAFGAVALAYLCLKLVRYVFMLWLPLYFTTIGCPLSLASLLAVTFEIGGAVGTALSGFAIQRVFKGRKILMTMSYCVLLTLSIVLFIAASRSIPKEESHIAIIPTSSLNATSLPESPTPFVSSLSTATVSVTASSTGSNDPLGISPLIAASTNATSLNETQTITSSPPSEDLKSRLFGSVPRATDRELAESATNLAPLPLPATGSVDVVPSRTSEVSPGRDNNDAILHGAYLMGMIMFLAGIVEPGFVLNGVVASELGEFQGRNVQAAVAGYINGIGGLGAVIQGPLVGFLADALGWAGVFYFVTLICILGAVSLFPALSLENKKFWKRESTTKGHL